MHEVADYRGAVEVLRHPNLVQALYEASPVVMADVLLTLHGEAHQQRRGIEFKVFNRHLLRRYEKEIFPAAFEEVLREYLGAGRADLIELGYRIVMNLTADFAGIDRTPGDLEKTDLLLELIKIFSIAATAAHSQLDRSAINASAEAAMDRLDADFLQPSIERRRQLQAKGEPLPNDILSSLLSEDEDLAPEILRREIAFFLQAGAHSTANATVHALHEILNWCETDPARRQRIRTDPVLLQRCVHESLRLHPASPVALRRANADISVATIDVMKGELVSADLISANRDAVVFGGDADVFNPERVLPDGVRPFGLSFGYGVHACLGRDLDGGVVPNAGEKTSELQLGIVPLIVQRLLQHDVQWIKDEPPEIDAQTIRQHFSSYPVSLQETAA